MGILRIVFLLILTFLSYCTFRFATQISRKVEKVFDPVKRIQFPGFQKKKNQEN